MNNFIDISLNKRLRIIFLLVLSLFSTASPILPDSIRPGNRPILESLVYENDGHEVGKTGFEVTAMRKAKAIARRLREQTAGGEISPLGTALYAAWLRPESYSFLYRLHLF
ncbi:hypothetical protein [Chitinophaga alhagiae]|uniref:hypothetical protein n=1 Tax=Chitinophaga alhagiae TaxID=2203219 RepID=UPI000E5A2DF3|nr:hypothetical protein [Chitinophaga alhagiae]